MGSRLPGPGRGRGGSRSAVDELERPGHDDEDALTDEVLVRAGRVVERALVDALQEHGEPELVEHVVVGEVADGVEAPLGRVAIDDLVTAGPAVARRGVGRGGRPDVAE